MLGLATFGSAEALRSGLRCIAELRFRTTRLVRRKRFEGRRNGAL
jgi:hypothetical protein